MMINKEFVIENLLQKNGRLNPRALERYGITREQAYNIMNDISEPVLCKVCSTPTALISFAKGYRVYCSADCVNLDPDNVEKKKKTIAEKYGEQGLKHTSITEKKKQTSRQRYGHDWPRQSKEYVQELKDKWYEEHGVVDFTHTPEAIEKRKQTNLKKYGCINPAQNSEIRKRIEDTNKKKYKVKTALMLDSSRDKALAKRREDEVYDLLNDKEWLESNKDVSSVTLSESLGVAWSTILNYFKKHEIDRSSSIVSNTETKVRDILDQLGVSYETNNRTLLDGKEIDIYIPNSNIGIEVNGVYWHSDRFIKDPCYHLNKMLAAEKKSVKLLHIFSTEIDNKLDIVKNRLSSKLGISSKIYARECTVVEINSQVYKSYVNKHHIQGYAAASVRLALVHNNSIQAVMSFSKSRFNKNYEWELIRYTSENTVVGGASKLLSYFKRVYEPESIISYADLRWNNGTMYEKLGMHFSHRTNPNYWYVVNDKLHHRTAFQKHKLKNKLKVYDPDKTEWENMQNNNIYKIWDCGNSVYTWRK